MQKYNAQPQVFEGIKFDSRWELTVYMFLRGYIPKDNILIHQKILIKPESKHYRARYWNCDFMLKWNNKILLIEAKGYPTKDFKRQLQLIDSNARHLIPLIRIITSEPIRVDECFKETLTPKMLIPELRTIQKEINQG